MCAEYVKEPKCRAKQLYEAAERIIDYSRITANLPATASFADVSDALSKLRDCVSVFDRLNRGM